MSLGRTLRAVGTVGTDPKGDETRNGLVRRETGNLASVAGTGTGTGTTKDGAARRATIPGESLG